MSFFKVFFIFKTRKIGVDVLCDSPIRQSVSEYFKLMENCFTKDEWIEIKNVPNEEDQLKRFRQFWTLKEAYTKSLGIGLGFDVLRISFQMINPV